MKYCKKNLSSSNGLSKGKSPGVLNLTKSFCTRLILISSLSLSQVSMARASADGDASDAVNAACANSTLSGMVYVKGGAPAGGNGSKNSPYNNLAAVQTPNPSNWKKLMVIPATSAATTLVGAITLKNCQNILGLGPNPVKSATNTIVATIKGPAAGDVITLTGNHKIKNLKIQDADRLAISLGSDTNNTAMNTGIANVSLHKVLVVNANKGDYLNLIVDHGPGYDGEPMKSFGQIAGLTYKSGKLDIVGSRIESGKNDGLFIANAGSAVRQLSVRHTTFKNLIASTTNTDTARYLTGNGISVGTTDAAQSVVKVDNAKFNTLAANAIQLGGVGNGQGAYNTAVKESASVTNSSFNNLRSPLIGFPAGLSLQTYDFINNDVSNARGAVFIFRGGPGVATDTVMNVKDNYFTNPTGSDYVVSAGHYDNDFDFVAFIGSFKFNVINNTFENVAVAPAAINSQFVVTSLIKGNKITNFNKGFDDTALSLFSSLAAPLLQDNCFVNGNAGITSFNLGVAFGIPAQFAHFVIDAGGGPLGSLGRNSFHGVGTDIQQDIGGEISAQYNYFDGTPVVSIGGEGFVETSNPLTVNPCASAGCGNDGHHRDGQTHNNPYDWDFHNDDGGWNEDNDH